MPGHHSPEEAQASLHDKEAGSGASDTGRQLFELLMQRWTLEILMILDAGEMRFTDLRTAIPKVSANILTQKLRELEGANLVARSYLPPPAASHVYRIGPRADGLRPAFAHIARWLASHDDPAPASQAPETGPSTPPSAES